MVDPISAHPILAAGSGQIGAFVPDPLRASRIR
jgi:hypothetical protein